MGKLVWYTLLYMDVGTHHLHLRKRMYKNLEAYPHPEALKRLFDRMMYVVGVAMPLALLPQVLQVYATHDVGELSFFTWSVLGFFNILWTIYGILHRTPPIIIGSAITGVFQFSLVWAIIAFG